MSETTYRGLLDSPVRPMELRETEAFIRANLGTVSDDLHARMMADPKVQTYHFLVGVLEARGWLPLVDRTLLLFIASIEGKPGMLMLWAFTFALLAQKHGRANFDSFVLAFPWGVPTEAGAKAAWYAQKKSFCNQVDDPAFWPAVPEVTRP